MIAFIIGGGSLILVQPFWLEEDIAIFLIRLESEVCAIEEKNFIVQGGLMG
jgi:hypothetical protein